MARTGILLVNLGTPAAPTPAAVRRYLAEFLADPLVVEIPRVIWWPILHGIILRVRPAKSAEKYRAIWTPEGSPLAVYTARQAVLLKGYLGKSSFSIDHAMRYGEPSIAAALERMQDCTRLLVVPMYPQYAGSTTGSALDCVERMLARRRNPAELRVVRSFPEHPGYIDALAESVRAHWQANGRSERLVMSFHGIPQRTVDRGDPYAAECGRTARALAARLDLAQDAWTLTFQSRFGRAEWLKPYTLPTLEGYAKQGLRRVDVICPGFVADCLETLEEIGVEARAAFLAAGGREFHLIGCLNDRPAWIRALMSIVEAHTKGWQ